MPAKVYLGVYTFACEVYLPRGGVVFNYSSAKTLCVRSRASQLVDRDILLRGCS